MYTPSCARVPKKSKIKDFNSNRNEPLIVLDYWSKSIEEDFHICNPENINISDKYKSHDVTNVMNSMVKHANYMEQGKIEI